MVARALSSNGPNVDLSSRSLTISSQRPHQPSKDNERKALNAINTNSTRQHRVKVRALASDPDLKGSEMAMKPQLRQACSCARLVPWSRDVHHRATPTFPISLRLALKRFSRHLKVASVIAMFSFGKVHRYPR